jgi:acetyl esterase/lipase
VGVKVTSIDNRHFLISQTCPKANIMRTTLRRPTLLLGLIAILIASPLAAEEAKSKFPLQNNDVWVMAGDSITAQHLHSNYFEAFCFARYPNLKFAFRNSGVGGHTIPSTLARFDYDIAGWKPTVVSVELGMNDKGQTTPEQFRLNMKAMIDRIRTIQARPILFAPSPVNNGETLAKIPQANARLHQFSVDLAVLAVEENVLYADQFHKLIDVWGKNKSRENLANSFTLLRLASRDDTLAGAEYLRKFLAAQDESKDKFISMQGDPVHPGPPGQLMMAAVLLSELGADPFVSSVTLDPTGTRVEVKGCTIADIVAKEGTLSFSRLDERLPFPIPEEARSVLPLCPTILDISQYTLQVTGLKPGQYTIKIDGIATATVSEKELDAGINLTAYGPNPLDKTVNPIAAQGRAILEAVAAKESLVGQWRNLSKRVNAKGSKPEMKDQLTALTTQVEEADAKIRTAAQPKKLQFEIATAAAVAAPAAAAAAATPAAAAPAAPAAQAAAPQRLALWNGRAPIGDGQFKEEDAFITVHQPAKPNGTAIVICPGGGYGGLVTDAEGHGIATWLNGHGITGVVLEYRLPAGRSSVPLADAQRAIRTVRARAKEWNLDPSRIGIIGFSAGGHLASTAGTHFDNGDKASADPIAQVSCRPDFTILIYPVISMTNKGHAGSKSNLLGKDPSPQLVDLYSNEKHVTAKTPPTFLAHPLDDNVVPVENSKMLFEALQANKIPSKLLELPSGGHGLNGYKGPMWEAWQKQSLEFLAEQKLIPADQK